MTREQSALILAAAITTLQLLAKDDKSRPGLHAAILAMVKSPVKPRETPFEDNRS